MLARLAAGTTVIATTTCCRGLLLPKLWPAIFGLHEWQAEHELTTAVGKSEELSSLLMAEEDRRDKLHDRGDALATELQARRCTADE